MTDSFPQACLQTWSLLRALGLPSPNAQAQWPPVRLLGFSKGGVVVNQVRGPFQKRPSENFKGPQDSPEHSCCDGAGVAKAC